VVAANVQPCQHASHHVLQTRMRELRPNGQRDQALNPEHRDLQAER
jgi:hypothetical protein